MPLCDSDSFGFLIDICHADDVGNIFFKKNVQELRTTVPRPQDKNTIFIHAWLLLPSVLPV